MFWWDYLSMGEKTKSRSVGVKTGTCMGAVGRKSGTVPVGMASEHPAILQRDRFSWGKENLFWDLRSSWLFDRKLSGNFKKLLPFLASASVPCEWPPPSLSLGC